MNNTLYWEHPESIALLAKALQEGGVAVGSSDTVLGLLALATQQGKEQLDKLKGRSEKPYLMLVKDIAMAQQLFHADVWDKVLPLVEAFWPGPLTIIGKAADQDAPYMVSKQGYIALRMPKHAGLQALLAMCNQPLFSTSANISTLPTPSTIKEIAPTILAQIACIIDDQDAKNDTMPSTIIECTHDAVKLIREGAISADAIKKALKG